MSQKRFAHSRRYPSSVCKPKIVSDNEGSSSGTLSIKALHRGEIFSINTTEVPSCFPATFHYPRHTNLFQSSAPHFPGALTRETRRGRSTITLFPLDLYEPRRQDTTNNRNFGNQQGFYRRANSRTDSFLVQGLIVEGLTIYLFSWFLRIAGFWGSVLIWMDVRILIVDYKS